MQKTKATGGFQLPPDISFHKEHGPAGWVYTFRHQTLGQLGRILLQNRPDGQCHVSVEISGDPDDPMSEERAAIFGPLGVEITRQMDMATGGSEHTPHQPVPLRTPPTVFQGFPTKHMQCKKCDAFVAVLIFANEATDASELEDCARLMFPKVKEWDLPTWVIGPSLGYGPPEERPAPVLKIWPVREPIRELRPDEFNLLISELNSTHRK